MAFWVGCLLKFLSFRNEISSKFREIVLQLNEILSTGTSLLHSDFEIDFKQLPVPVSYKITGTYPKHENVHLRLRNQLCNIPAPKKNPVDLEG
jgi:hypothetical protein